MHRPTAALPIVAVALLVGIAACASPTPQAAPPPASASAPASVAVASPSAALVGRRPIVLDTDLAADDIFALLVLSRDPRVDLRGVTIAGTGEVHCAPGIRNARRALAALGVTGVPVACGRENPGPNGRSFPPEWRAGADAFYGLDLPAVAGETDVTETAPELLVRLAKDATEPLTLVTLGPLTNVADAAALDPAFASRLAGIHSMAGAIDDPGNIDYGGTTAADGVEWNVGADPDAMAAVLALDVPLTLVGLDATNDVPVPADIVDVLGSDHVAAGADIAYQMYARNPFLSTGGSSYWDPLAAMTLGDPLIAGWEDVTLGIEPTGPGAGHLFRDPTGRPVRAAMSADREAFMTDFLAALRTGS